MTVRARSFRISDELWDRVLKAADEQDRSASYIIRKQLEKLYDGNKKSAKKEVKESVLPDYINKELWTDFLKMREKLKAINSDRAKNSLLSELDRLRSQGMDPNRVILESIKNSWKGVFPLKSNNDNKTSYKDFIQ